MIKELDTDDWSEAFGYANFNREDVKKIIAISEGMNDGDSWLLLCRLKTGNYAFLSAWCDYTGWDCQAGGRCEIDISKKNLIEMKMGKEERSRLGVSIKNDFLTN